MFVSGLAEIFLLFSLSYAEAVGESVSGWDGGGGGGSNGCRNN